MMRALSLAACCFAAGALVLPISGCDSNADERAELVKLSSSCRINSDCGSLLVCVFERCHEQCESSRDCEDGARCVQSPQRRNVCQLPDEQSCREGSACPEGQVCGIDAECRDGCSADAQCLTEQVCSAGTCADLVEVDEQGQLEPAPERPATRLVPCAFDSDCPAQEICSSGACKLECQTSADCTEGEQCEEGACEALPSSGTCLRSSDCPIDQACVQGACITSDPPIEPACRYDSDCAVEGQHCVGGECSCECSVDADCGGHRVCFDECACRPNRVIDGDVVVSNVRELQLLQDVVEITGRLELQIRGAAEHHLPNLRKVRFLGAWESAGTIWLDALEEATEGLSCYQDCRAPRLRSVGNLTLTSAGFRTIELPELETAGDVNLWYCTALTEVSLPKLKTAANFRIQTDTQLTELSVPKLAAIDSLVIGGNDRLKSISLPLVSPRYNVDLANNNALEHLVLPAVKSLEGRVSLSQHPKLKSVELTALTQAHQFQLQLMPELQVLSVPALSRVVADVYISSTNVPEVLDLPALTRVGSFTLAATTGTKSISAPLLIEANDFVVIQSTIEAIDLPLQSLSGQLSLDANPKLATLKLAELTSTDRLSLSMLPLLTSMDLSALASTNDILINRTGLTNLTSLHYGAGGSLASAGNLEITFNPALPHCAITVLTSTLVDQGWNGLILVQDNLSCADCQGAECL
jgi:hypothetical protein